MALVLLFAAGCQPGAGTVDTGRARPRPTPSEGDAGSGRSDAQAEADAGDVIVLRPPDAGPGRDAQPELDAGVGPGDHPDPCGDGIDGDGNGLIDDGCACEPGRTQPCHPDGAMGACSGTQTCVGSGAWGACEGAITPTEELCGDGVDQDCDGVDPECDDPRDLCARADRTEMTLRPSFSNPRQTLGLCPWNVGDNLSPDGGEMTARHEVTQELELPEGAILCSLDFTIPGAAMFYDDTMLVLMNDVVILAPWNPSLYFESRDGLFVYDWLRFRGRPAGNRSTYCPGEVSVCSIPGTEDRGTIRLDLDDPTIDLLNDLVATQDRADFTAVAAGDNDSGDCSHLGFEVEVNVEYVLP